jgi:hypothetical protein
MTSPAVARQRSHARDRDLSIAVLSCGWQRFFRSAASRDVTGQGPRRGQLASTRHLPPRSLAARASPQPDRLGHLLSPLVTIASWSRLHRGRDSLEYPLSRARLTGSLSRSRLPGRLSPTSRKGPPHVYPREGERAPPHPRCLPSPDNPCRGSPRLPQTVPSLWTSGAAPLRSPHVPAPLTRLTGR